MTETTTTLPVPANAETAVAISGEVITPETKAEMLRTHEANIRKNWKKALGGVQNIARSLNVIYYNELWKLHVTGDGKRRYTNFNDYLTAEFGWDKTPARARQIMKQDLPDAIEAGEVPEGSGSSTRQRSAPEIDVLKACMVTHKQLQTVAEALANRRGNVTDTAEALAEWNEVADEAIESLNATLSALNDLAARMAEEPADDDEDDEDADDDADEDDDNS